MARLRPLVALLAFFAGALAAAPVRAQEGTPVGFITALGDVPLMPGFIELPELGMRFDKPGGRIIEAFAQGVAEKAAVLAFYGASLPQLGWDAAGPAHFRREGEVLRLDFIAGGTVTTVRFFLSPG